MDNKKLTGEFSKLNNNQKQKFKKSYLRKSMSLNPKISFDKTFRNNSNLEIINEDSEQNNNLNDKNNYDNPTKKNLYERIRMKRRGTERFYIKNTQKIKIINKDYVFAFLSKHPNSRKEKEITSVAKYLSDNYKYFTNLKNVDSQLKVEKLTKVIKLEEFKSGENIIKYGEVGDKFYIVLEGFVEIYKPFFESISATKNEFIEFLNHVKKVEKNENKYLRIKQYNKEKNIDISEYENIDSNMKFMNVKEEFYIEKLEKFGKYGEGFSFGEMSLLKHSQRNATIKSVGGPNESTILLSIDKESYNQAIKEYEEKKITKEVEVFFSTYPFIYNFHKDKILKIFNCMNRINLEKDEYLFHQNDEDDNLYFIINGTFSLSVEICYLWLNEYIDYIYNMKENMLGYLYAKRPKKFSHFFEIMEKFKENKSKSPMIFDKYYLWEKMEDKKNENNLIGVKTDEEKLNNSNNIYKLHIKNIEKPVLLGIEDSFEFKNKFYSIKCISEKGEIKSIKVIDFLKIIFNFKEDDLLYLLETILKRKQMLKEQIIKSVKYLSKTILNKLEFKYETLLNTERIINNEKDKKNKIVSLIKMKGYKNSIQDILDSPINFLGINKRIKYNSEDKKNNKLYHFEDLIHSSKLKSQIKKKDIDKNNKENLLILKKILRVNKTNKNLKKIYKNELNLSSFYATKNFCDVSIQKPSTDRKKLNNFSTINSNNETNVGNNTFNNLININNNNSNKNNLVNITSYKEIDSISQKNNLNFNEIKSHKKNKTTFKFYKRANNSKSYKNIFPAPINFKNYCNNKLNHFTQRDFLHQKKSNPTKALILNASINEKSSILNYNNNSEIYISDKGFNLKEIEKSYIDSKKDINLDNSLYGYVDCNKDFYLCSNFSKKFKTIFENNSNTKNHNFPLLNKDKFYK